MAEMKRRTRKVVRELFLASFPNRSFVFFPTAGEQR